MESVWELVGAEIKRGDRIYGVVPALVTNNVDPEKLGRIKVRYPWLTGNASEESHWARLVQEMAGGGRGTWFLPEVDSEVLVAFSHGDMRFPYVLGALWNNVDKAPITSDVDGKPESETSDLNKDGRNSLRFIRSRCGHIVKLDEGNVALTAMDKTGNHRVELLSKEKQANFFSADGNVKVDAPQGRIYIKAKRVILDADEQLEVAADTHIDAQSQGRSIVHGGETSFGSNTDLTLHSKSSLRMEGGSSLSYRAQMNTTLMCFGGSLGMVAGGVLKLKGAQVCLNAPPIPVKVGKQVPREAPNEELVKALKRTLAAFKDAKTPEEKKRALVEALQQAAAGGALPDPEAAKTSAEKRREQAAERRAGRGAAHDPDCPSCGESMHLVCERKECRDAVADAPDVLRTG